MDKVCQCSKAVNYRGQSGFTRPCKLCSQYTLRRLPCQALIQIFGLMVMGRQRLYRSYLHRKAATLTRLGDEAVCVC